MNNKKQSSIDWLENEIDFILTTYSYNSQDFHLNKAFEQAKAMHKEEHGQTWDKSMENFEARGRNEMRAWVDFDAYYNETFGGQDNE